MASVRISCIFMYFLDTPTFARNKSFFPKGSTRLSGKCRNQSSLASMSSGNPSLSNIGTAHCGSLCAQTSQTLLWLVPDLEVQLRFSDGSVAKKLFVTTKVACIEALGVKPIDLQASAMVELSGLRKVAVFPASSLPPSSHLFHSHLWNFLIYFLHCFTQSVRINWINRRCHPNQCLCQEFPGPIDRLLLEVIAKTPDNHCWCWVVDIGKSFGWWMGAQVAVNSLGESVASQPLQMLSLFNFSLLKRCFRFSISVCWKGASCPTSQRRCDGTHLCQHHPK